MNKNSQFHLGMKLQGRIGSRNLRMIGLTAYLAMVLFDTRLVIERLDPKLNGAPTGLFTATVSRLSPGNDAKTIIIQYKMEEIC